MGGIKEYDETSIIDLEGYIICDIESRKEDWFVYRSSGIAKFDEQHFDIFFTKVIEYLNYCNKNGLTKRYLEIAKGVTTLLHGVSYVFYHYRYKNGGSRLEVPKVKTKDPIAYYSSRFERITNVIFEILEQYENRQHS